MPRTVSVKVLRNRGVATADGICERVLDSPNFQGICQLCGQMWVHVGKSWNMWKHVGPCSNIWDFVGFCGIEWEYNYGMIYNNMVQFVIIKCLLSVSCAIHWSHLPRFACQVYTFVATPGQMPLRQVGGIDLLVQWLWKKQRLRERLLLNTV